MKNKSSVFAVIASFVALLFLHIPPCYAQELLSGESAGEAVFSDLNDDAVKNQAEGGDSDVQKTQNDSTAPKTAVPLSDEQKRIDMEIKTSTLPELAAWCRRLGLSEGGDVRSLQNVLRNYYNIFSAAADGSEQEKKQKIITIISARSTEYFKIEAIDEEYARLTGDVRVSLKDGDAVHDISAWDILFNRTRNIITAKGGVEYKKTEGDKIETFRGDSITVNIDNWESIFLGGISQRSLESDGTTYLFSGTVISRDEEDVTVLTKGSISGTGSEESLWSVKASRIWLLPGSDFAIFNAVLKVGEIPVMYIPFFYFPADEVIFHPVIGYRNREGNFIQTTTYILGRRKASSTSESSLTKILGNSNDMEKKREGLFLRSTGKKVRDENATTLTLMLDYYTNLGGYIATDLTTPKFGFLNPIEFNAGFGFSRTIVQNGNDFSPFAPYYDGKSDWNKSMLFSFEVPFRYRFNIKSGISGKYGSLNWEIPYYSDPWMDRDFAKYRAEDMDWVNMIQKGAALEADKTDEIQMGSYTWRLSGSISPKFPDMSPFISNISINGFSTSIGFNSKVKNIPSGDPEYYSPTRAFYFPNSATLYSVGGSISGTPINLGVKNTGNANPWTKNQQETEEKNPFADIGTPLSPWESEKTDSGQAVQTQDTLTPPVLSQNFSINKGGTTQFSLGYLFSPLSASEMQFDSLKWNNFNDINWGDIESVLTTASGNANATLSLKHSEGLYSSTFVFSGRGDWRQYSYINEDAKKWTPTTANPKPVSEARRQQYNQTNFYTSYDFNTSLSPLYLSNIWKGTKLTYLLKGLAVKSEFIGTGDKPDWKMVYGEWDKDKIESHKLTANFSASILDQSQSLSLSADLPPKTSNYSANASFNIWYTTTTASMQVKNLEDEKKRKLEPFSLSEVIKFGTFGTLTQNMILDTEKKEWTSITTNLNLSKLGLSSAYSATRTAGYKLGPTGWITSTDKPTLKSNNFYINFNKSFNKNNIWNNRFNFTLTINSRLNFDLQRYTNSSFTLGLALNMLITDFLNLTISFDSKNSVIYRYYRGLLPDLPAAIRDAKGEQYNLFTDLWNSFRFDDDDRRRSSGFKMDRFNLTAVHYLGDWNANLTLTMSPDLPQGSRQYKLSTDFTFLVQWKPISEIKSDMSYNEKTNKWIVK